MYNKIIIYDSFEIVRELVELGELFKTTQLLYNYALMDGLVFKINLCFENHLPYKQ